MRTATLVRSQTGDSGTFGVLTSDSGRPWASGELPWRGNLRGLSCVRAGTYQVKMQYSPAHGRTVYTLQDVPCRSEVEIHSGNVCGDVDKGLKSDVRGCIILGESRGAVDGQPAVINSKKAIAEFENDMGGDPFTLEITWELPDGSNPETQENDGGCGA